MKHITLYIKYIFSGIIISAAIIFGLSFTVIAIVNWYESTTLVSSDKLKSAFEISTQCERAGSISIREYIRAKIINNQEKFGYSGLTIEEYKHILDRADWIKKQAMVKIFMDGQFQYLDKDGFGVNLPEGYINRKENRDNKETVVR